MAILNYAELITGIVGLLLVLIMVMICILLIAKTAGKLKKAIIYFLFCIALGGVCIGGRLLNIEMLLPEGKLINLFFAIFVSFFALMGLIELNEIINEIHNGKRKYDKNKPSKEKSFRRTIVENISNKYLDLTGRKPKFRN